MGLGHLSDRDQPAFHVSLMMTLGIYATRALKEIGAAVADNIVLTIVPDQESGGKRGSESGIGKSISRLHGV